MASMPEYEPEFRKVPIEPIECLKSAKDMISGDYFWTFVAVCAIGAILAGLAPFGLLMGPMYCGIYLCHIAHRKGESISVNLLFKGFDYFLESLIATLIFFGVMMALIFPLYFAMIAVFFGMGIGAQGGAPGDAVAFGMLGMMGLVYVAIIIVIAVASTLFAFVYPLIVDRNMKAIPALKSSAKAVWANFGGMLGLTFLSGLLTFVASLFCYLPVFLVFPITFGANYLAYLKVFPEPSAEAVGGESAELG